VLASSANFHGFGVCRAELSGLVLTSGTWAGLRGTATAKRAHLAVGALRKFRLTAPHPWLRRALQLQGPQRDSSAAQTHVRTVTDTARRRTCRGTHAWAQPRRGQACREGGGDARTHTQPFQCLAPSGARSTAPRRERGESRHSHPGAVAPAAGAAQRDGQPGACLHGARARRARPPLMRGRGRRCARGTLRPRNAAQVSYTCLASADSTAWARPQRRAGHGSRRGSTAAALQTPRPRVAALTATGAATSSTTSEMSQRDPLDKIVRDEPVGGRLAKIDDGFGHTTPHRGPTQAARWRSSLSACGSAVRSGAARAPAGRAR